MCSARCRCLASAEEVKIPPGRRGVLWGLGAWGNNVSLALPEALTWRRRHGIGGWPCVAVAFAIAIFTSDIGGGPSDDSTSQDSSFGYVEQDSSEVREGWAGAIKTPSFGRPVACWER
jgi:hypothetical protein